MERVKREEDERRDEEERSKLMGEDQNEMGMDSYMMEQSTMDQM